MGKGVDQRYSSSNMDLTYNVDFNKRTGAGYLTKGDTKYYYGDKITLNEGTISNVNVKGSNVIGISSTAKSLNNVNGNYSIGFYGTEAQEIVGALTMPEFSGSTNNTEYGLAGQRGEITK